MNHNHVVTGLPAKGTTRDLSHIILDFKAENFTKGVIDHIDGNPLNNRKENLRICTQGENTLNKSFISNNTSGFIGVSYHNQKCQYQAYIGVNKKRIYLGSYDNIADAIRSRLCAEMLYYGPEAPQKHLFKEYGIEQIII
jgi:hypothetical protein